MPQCCENSRRIDRRRCKQIDVPQEAPGLVNSCGYMAILSKPNLVAQGNCQGVGVIVYDSDNFLCVHLKLCCTRAAQIASRVTMTVKLCINLWVHQVGYRNEFQSQHSVVGIPAMMDVIDSYQCTEESMLARRYYYCKPRGTQEAQCYPMLEGSIDTSGPI